MEIPENRFKRRLKQGERLFGLWSTLGSSITVELLAGAGFDWLLIDTEHSPSDLESVLVQLQAAAAYPTSPIVRVPWNDFVAIKRYLDIGSQTLLIPYVSTPDEARRAVAATRYPPQGIRGVAGTTRAARFGRVADYALRAHEQLCVLVQAETRLALENLEDICAVDGIDGVFIGPSDLHASLGFPGESAHPDVVPQIEDAIRRIRRAGKAPGILTGDEALARRYLDAGALFVAVGIDSTMLARAADALALRYRTLA